MSFLNPLILFGLAAAILPLIIHLFTRTKLKTVRFSTLDFLQKLQNEQVRRLKLRQLLLLILRTLIIVMLILAFARPTVERHHAAGRNVSAGAATSMAIIIDNSASMLRPGEGGSLYNKMRSCAEAIASIMRPGDEAFLVASTDTSLAVSKRAFHDPQFFRRALNELEMSYTPTNLTAALTYADRLLAARSNINKEIYLLSDMQRTAFQKDSLSLSDDVKLYLWPLTALRISNLAILESRLSSAILQKGRIAEAIVTVRNTGDEPEQNALLQLYVNGRRSAQATLDLNPAEVQSKTFRFEVDATGFSQATFELEDDDFVLDNSSFIAFYVPEKIRVAVVGDSRDVLLFKLATAADDMESFVELTSLAESKLTSESLAAYDVLVLTNFTALNRNAVEKIKNFVDNGGGLFVAIGDRVDIRAFNNQFASALNLPPVIDVIDVNQNRNILLSKIDFGHPLFDGVFEKESADVSRPEFRFAVKVKPNDRSRSIMYLSSGDPLLLEQLRDKGKVLLMTSAFSPNLSNISRRTIFAPLVNRILAYGASSGSTSAPLHVGDELRYKLDATDVAKLIEIKRPDDKFDRLQPAMTASGAWVHYALTNIPGVYELLLDGSIQYMWAVQSHSSEMIFNPADVKKLVQAEDVVTITDKGALTELVAAARHGRELWLYFALAALVLILLEMLVYREKGEVPTD